MSQRNSVDSAQGPLGALNSALGNAHPTDLDRSPQHTPTPEDEEVNTPVQLADLHHPVPGLPTHSRHGSQHSKEQPKADDMVFPGFEGATSIASFNTQDSGATRNGRTTFLSWCKMQIVVKPQLFLAVLVHLFTMFVIFQHFWYFKYLQRQAGVPAAAPHRWQKILVPAFEFATMHTNLYLMSLLPITMCHRCMVYLRRTFLNQYLPLDHAVPFHKYLGTWLVMAVFASTAVFFGHFGSLCQWSKDGKEPPGQCDLFRTEIMTTGLVLFGLTAIIAVTAFPPVRNRIPYEVFYWGHHAFVAMYIIGIIHTLDAKGRNKFNSRSQNVLWYTGPLLIYSIDRIMRWALVRRCSVTACKLMDEPCSMVLSIVRPRGFSYQAGQYLKLNIPAVSATEWHPFSIASAPSDSKELQLFIKVTPSGWTERMFSYLKHFGALHRNKMGAPQVFIDGPYGSSLQSAFHQQHVVMLCTGPGIVPMLSLVRDLRHRGRIQINAPRLMSTVTPAATPGVTPGGTPRASQNFAGTFTSPGHSRDEDALSAGQLFGVIHPRASDDHSDEEEEAAAARALMEDLVKRPATSQVDPARRQIRSRMHPASKTGSENLSQLNGSQANARVSAANTIFMGDSGSMEESDFEQDTPNFKGAAGDDKQAPIKYSMDSLRRSKKVVYKFELAEDDPDAPRPSGGSMWNAAVSALRTNTKRFSPADRPGDGKSPPVAGKEGHASRRHFMKNKQAFEKFTQSPLPMFATYLQTMRRDAAHTFVQKGTWLLALRIVIGSLQIALIALDLSFHSNDVEERWPLMVSSVLTAVCVAHLVGSVATAWYMQHASRFSTRAATTRGTGPLPAQVLAYINRAPVHMWLMHLLVASALGILEGFTFGAQKSNATLACVVVLRAYQAVWEIGPNPLFTGRSVDSTEQRMVDAAFVQSVELNWSVPSARQFTWLWEELDQIVRKFRATQGPEMLTVEVAITQASREEQKFVKHMIAGSALEGCVRFRRVDFDSLINRVKDRHRTENCAHGVPRIVGINFCGNKLSSKKVLQKLGRHLQNRQPSDPHIIFSSESILE